MQPPRRQHVSPLATTRPLLLVGWPARPLCGGRRRSCASIPNGGPAIVQPAHAPALQAHGASRTASRVPHVSVSLLAPPPDAVARRCAQPAMPCHAPPAIGCARREPARWRMPHRGSRAFVAASALIPCQRHPAIDQQSLAAVRVPRHCAERSIYRWRLCRHARHGGRGRNTVTHRDSSEEEEEDDDKEQRLGRGRRKDAMPQSSARGNSHVAAKAGQHMDAIFSVRGGGRRWRRAATGVPTFGLPSAIASWQPPCYEWIPRPWAVRPRRGPSWALTADATGWRRRHPFLRACAACGK